MVSLRCSHRELKFIFVFVLLLPFLATTLLLGILLTQGHCTDRCWLFTLNSPPQPCPRYNLHFSGHARNKVAPEKSRLNFRAFLKQVPASNSTTRKRTTKLSTHNYLQQNSTVRTAVNTKLVQVNVPLIQKGTPNSSAAIQRLKPSRQKRSPHLPRPAPLRKSFKRSKFQPKPTKKPSDILKQRARAKSEALKIRKANNLARLALLSRFRQSQQDPEILQQLGSTPQPPNFTWVARKAFTRCSKQDLRPLLLILVHSARYNFKRRRSIRQTWGSIQTYGPWSIVVVFIVGETNPSEYSFVPKKLEYESKIHGDIAKKSSFIDCYRNMSYKHLAGYEWATSFCPNASFVVKTDDDVIIDVFKLIKWISGSVNPKLNAYYCRSMAHQLAHRQHGDKWYVSKEEYQRKSFPTFCSGGAYSTTMKVMKMVHRAIQNVPLLWLDDVYVTGLGVEYVNNVTKRGGYSRSNLITHVDRSDEYIYHHYMKTGMELIREWCNSTIDYSPWTFLLVRHGRLFQNDWDLVWRKICKVHDYQLGSSR